ncbi:MAG: cupredoxin domain-containing protein [Candidatus Magasanikbacteria bacterium]|nr:cupredoxin domain-containing protein [Candidatus Magasanikbacteria bacterium]MCA9389191.1 cupredoxin domain-containing protein [Candidatus Magasanikbacteria bacterium]MCA9390965.1 cupredoxin domain-containing protein [Candidatus Magasanikbacteria bacterium]USN52119.1 MAG: cupredoxin domain-containing protein [Candidatus Nomurabacteria bacterium]HPF95040.1 cupredoxin domain-containing protein [bacterium]
MKLMFSRAVATLATASMLAAPLAAGAATTGAFNAGDLIKASGAAVYYFAPNGKRYVFPNDKTYFTWYKDFSGVRTISDGALSSIPLGGNVTYRPGYKMVKITTDPRTYVVDQGGILRQIGSEQLAQTLYGPTWNSQVDDIPDAFFVNYRLGTQIQTASDYNPENVKTLTTTISQDKQFDETLATITIGSVSNGFVPATLTVKKGTTVTWTNRDIVVHSVVGNGFNSGDVKPGDSYSKQFNTVGSFDYSDTINPVMQGTINVQ